MGTLADLFYIEAKKHPKKVAVICETEKLTYEELAAKVSQFSSYFLQQGISLGEHIGVPMTNSIESVALLMAAANIGAAIVPINPTLPIKQVEQLFTEADVNHIVARGSFLKKFELSYMWNEIKTIICIDDARFPLNLQVAQHEKVARPIIKVSNNMPFIITMTSGSTGFPKPILLTQQDKLDRIYAHVDLYAINSDEIILSGTPLYHSLAERLVLMPLVIGATSVILPRFTPRLWLECVTNNKVTFTIAVSAQLAQIIKILNEDNNLTSMRCLVSSSALLDEQVKQRLINKINCEFHEMYGASEVSTVTSINFKEARRKNKSVGKPLKEAKVIILNDKGQLCKSNEIGEIGCKTSLQCKGYYKRDEIFRQSFYGDYFMTGDLGYLDEEGYLYFAGRKKELIITGGINVYPPDIENCLLILQEVLECAAVPYPDEKLGEIVAAVIVKSEEIDERTIRFHCAQNLADYQQPRKIIFVENLPKNSMGKVVKSEVGKLLVERYI